MRAGLLGVLLLSIAASSAVPSIAQVDGPEAPTALIVTYRAKPEARQRFRALLQTEGVAQFERWRKNGTLASYLLLVPAYAAAGKDTPDAYAIVRFAHFTDLGRWEEIERTAPGGLPASAQAIAWADTAGTADIVKDSRAAASTKNSQFFILTYDVAVPVPAYRKYAAGYVIPQFEEWMKAGILSSYVLYTNQNPAGAPWTSLILLEYKDLHSLGERELVKEQARKSLAQANPEWKRWSEDKSNIRKELTGVPAVALH